MLRERNINLRSRFFAQSHMSDAFDHTDDLRPDRLTIASVERYAPADRVLIRPVPARQRFVDDHNRRRVAAVTFRENTAFQKLNSLSLKIAGTDAARAGGAMLAGGRRRLPFDIEPHVLLHTAQRHRIDRARGLDARERAQTLKQLLEKDRLLRPRVFAAR